MAIEYAVTRNGVPDRGPAVFGVALATLVFCSIFVVARLVTRMGIVKRVSLDDYFIVAAWFLAFGVTFTIAYGSRKGLGRHDEDIPPELKPDLRRCEYVFSVLYNPALMATKTSILVFYLRLSKNTQPILRAASKLVLGIVNIAGTVLTLLNIFQCRPIEAAFNGQSQAEAMCIPLLTEFICSAPVNILTDLAILALPLPVLTSMRLPPRQKTILVFTFALGVFVTIVDVVRIYYLQQAITSISLSTSSDPNSQFGQTRDFSWNASLSFMWSAVEVNVGITCACIPTLKPLFMKILPAVIVDPDGTGRSGSNTLDKDSSDAPSQAVNERARQTSAIGAGGGLQGSAPVQARDGSVDAQDQIGMLDFLTTPAGMAPGTADQEKAAVTQQPTTPSRSRFRSIHPSTNSTLGSALSREETSTYFGFVEIRKPRSILRTNASDSFKYCTVVTIIFLLWGFSYGMLNTLNNVVAAVANMSTAQTLGLTSVYFGGGYLFGPLLIGEWVLRHDEHQRSRRGSFTHRNNEPVGGFKATFMVGLCIYGAGTIMFWPSAVLASFPGFLICSFVVGFGLGVLETAANPFIALCGPPAYAEMRLLLAQGVQGVGSVLSGLLAQRVYFANLDNKVSTDSRTLLDVQWTYLAITMFSVALALLFYYMPLPEVSDAELERTTKRLAVDPKKPSIGGIKLRTVCLILAVLAQWTYVAAQETMSIYFRDLLLSWLPPDNLNALANSGNATDNGISAFNPNSGGPPTDNNQPPGFKIAIPDYLNLAHAAFAISRFAAAYIAYLSVKLPNHRLIPTPRTMLAWCAGVSALAALLIVVLRPSTSGSSSDPNVIVTPVVIYFLAEGPLWPLIFTQGLKGQGGRTKWAAVWLTVGGSGPAFWPYVVYAVVQAGGAVQTGLIVLPVLMVVTLVYPLWLTFVRDAKKLVDPVKPGEERTVEGYDNAGDEEGGGSQHAEEATDEPTTSEMIAARRKSMRKERRKSASENGNGWWSKRKRRRSSGASGVSPHGSLSNPSGAPATDYFEDARDARPSNHGREREQDRVSDISEER